MGGAPVDCRGGGHRAPKDRVLPGGARGARFLRGPLDARGRMVAQGDFSPGHLGSMPSIVSHVLREYPVETLEPGDAIVLNDLYMGSGHLPDFFLTAPVFHDDRLVGSSWTARTRWMSAAPRPDRRPWRGSASSTRKAFACCRRDLARRPRERRGHAAHHRQRPHAGDRPGRPEGDAQLRPRGRAAAPRAVRALRGRHGAGHLGRDPRPLRARDARGHPRAAARALHRRGLLDDCGRNTDPLGSSPRSSSRATRSSSTSKAPAARRARA